MFSVVDAFPCRAAVRSVAWSSASAWTSPAGLVAAGLENGGVSVWEPTCALEMLGEPGLLADADTTKLESLVADINLNYFGAAAPQDDDEQAKAARFEFLADQDDTDYVDVGALAHFAGEGVAVSSCLRPPILLDTVRRTYNRVSPWLDSSDKRERAYFTNHKDPISGLSFNPGAPYILASAAKDKVVLWDISNASAHSVPVWEHCCTSQRISSLDWNGKSPNLFAYCTLEGNTEVFDSRLNVLCNSWSPTPRKMACSCVRYNPNKEHQMVVSFEDSGEHHSVYLWDVRCSKCCLWKTCEYSGGTRTLSWSNENNIILAATNRSRILFLNANDYETVTMMSTSTPPLDLQWSNTDKSTFIAAFDQNLIAYEHKDEVLTTTDQVHEKSFDDKIVKNAAPPGALG